jgi:hypothetical protein
MTGTVESVRSDYAGRVQIPTNQGYSSGLPQSGLAPPLPASYNQGRRTYSLDRDGAHYDRTYPPPQLPAIWASHVGRAAAAMPSRPLLPSSVSAAGSPVSRLALAAAHLHHRARVKEDSDRTLKANEFLVGD